MVVLTSVEEIAVHSESCVQGQAYNEEKKQAYNANIQMAMRNLCAQAPTCLKSWTKC